MHAHNRRLQHSTSWLACVAKSNLSQAPAIKKKIWITSYKCLPDCIAVGLIHRSLLLTPTRSHDYPGKASSQSPSPPPSPHMPPHMPPRMPWQHPTPPPPPPAHPPARRCRTRLRPRTRTAPILFKRHTHASGHRRRPWPRPPCRPPPHTAEPTESSCPGMRRSTAQHSAAPAAPLFQPCQSRRIIAGPLSRTCPAFHHCTAHNAYVSSLRRHDHPRRPRRCDGRVSTQRHLCRKPALPMSAPIPIPMRAPITIPSPSAPSPSRSTHSTRVACTPVGSGPERGSGRRRGSRAAAGS